MNLNNKQSKGTHQITLFIGRNMSVFFDFFWYPIYFTRSIKQNKRHVDNAQHI